ncbi:MAG: hypothetical protein AB7P07_02365 [Hyphomonadaceae bacterium]
MDDLLRRGKGVRGRRPGPGLTANGSQSVVTEQERSLSRSVDHMAGKLREVSEPMANQQTPNQPNQQPGRENQQPGREQQQQQQPGRQNQDQERPERKEDQRR